jgi:methionyl-tRNA synthetase
MKQTKHWYLPLNRYESWLREWIIDGHKHDWRPNVYGQCKSWIDGGLQARAVTRDLDWGVKVPLENTQGKVLYVWFDAPIGYISATKELTPHWEKYWKDSQTKLVHFIGKDNIVFHCIIFPAMLKAEGSYIMPDNVPSNEFLNLEGDKISTSRNWAVWLHEYLRDFEGKQDVLRYVLTANAPETKDNDFTWKDFQTRNNSELVAILGNFVNRALVLTQKYFNGKVPSINELSSQDQEVIAEIANFPQRIEDALENYRFREALREFMNLARLGNKYLADTEPWKLIKTDENRVATILNISLQIVANLSILGNPFLPFSMEKIRQMLNISALEWEKAGQTQLLLHGHQLSTPSLLFEQIEDTAIEVQLQRLQDTKKANQLLQFQAQPAKESVAFEDFGKMDIRVATILEAEKVAKTKKLMKLTVDTGFDKRTVVSGIAEFFEPEQLIGQQVNMLVNLAPREIKGILSQGMILLAEDADGKLVLMQPARAVKNGSEVK